MLGFLILPPKRAIEYIKKFDKGTNMAGICKSCTTAANTFVENKKRCTINTVRKEKIDILIPQDIINGPKGL